MTESGDLLCGLVQAPPNFDRWNRAMRGAYRKGVQSFIEGGKLFNCPYEDIRKPSGRLSWSRAFIACWQDGFKDAARYAAQREARQCVTDECV